MSKTEQKNFRNMAKEAKARLKNGFWENYRRDLAGELARAKSEGLNESKVERYFAGKITYTISGGDDEGFYEKVRRLLLAEGRVSDAIGRLTDKEEFEKLSYEEKQRYTLRLSEKYLKALERFRREMQFERRG